MTRSTPPFARARGRAALAAITVLLFATACQRSDSPATTTAAATEATTMQTGLDLLRKGDANRAVETFREVLAKNPTHYGAHFQLAKALDRAGTPAEARPRWEEVLKLAEASKDTSTVSVARTRLAQPDTASQEAMMKSGLAFLYAQNNPGAAVEEFRKVLQRNPTHYGAHFQLARALDKAGKADEAREMWKRVLSLAEAIKDKPTADTARNRLQSKS